MPKRGIIEAVEDPENHEELPTPLKKPKKSSVLSDKEHTDLTKHLRKYFEQLESALGPSILWPKELKELLLSPSKLTPFYVWKAICYARVNRLDENILITWLCCLKKWHTQHFESETEFIGQIKKAFKDIEERENKFYFAWDITLQTLVFVKTLEPVSTLRPEAKYWTKYTYGKLNTEGAGAENNESSSFL